MGPVVLHPLAPVVQRLLGRGAPGGIHRAAGAVVGPRHSLAQRREAVVVQRPARRAPAQKGQGCARGLQPVCGLVVPGHALGVQHQPRPDRGIGRDRGRVELRRDPVAGLHQRAGVAQAGETAADVAQRRVFGGIVGKGRTDEPQEPARLLAAFADLMDAGGGVEARVVKLGQRAVDLFAGDAAQGVLRAGVLLADAIGHGAFLSRRGGGACPGHHGKNRRLGKGFPRSRGHAALAEAASGW